MFHLVIRTLWSYSLWRLDVRQSRSVSSILTVLFACLSSTIWVRKCLELVTWDLQPTEHVLNDLATPLSKFLVHPTPVLGWPLCLTWCASNAPQLWGWGKEINSDEGRIIIYCVVCINTWGCSKWFYGMSLMCLLNCPEKLVMDRENHKCIPCC